MSTATKPTNAAKNAAKNAKLTPAQVEEQTYQRVSSNEIVNALQKSVPTSEQITVNLLRDLYIDKSENIRELNSYTDEDIDQMKMQIVAAGGIFMPIVLYEIAKDEATENKPYGLLMGFRRSIALRELAETDAAYIEKVPAVVTKSVDTSGAVKLMQLLENVARRDLTPIEKARTIRDILDDNTSNLTASDVGQVLGMSEQNVSQLLKLVAKLPVEIQDMVHNGELSFSHAREMVYSLAPESRYKELVELAKNDTATEFRDRLEKMYPKTKAQVDSDGKEVSTGKSSTQKRTSMIRATALDKTYIPFLEEKIAEVAKSGEVSAKYTEADLLKARLDTIKTIQMDSATDLSKAIAPYILEQEKKEEEAKANKETVEKKDAFFHTLGKQVDGILAAPIDPEKPDAPRVNLAGAYAAVVQGVVNMEAEQVKALGFPLDNKNKESIYADLKSSYEEILKKRVEDKQKADKKKAEKKAEEDKKKAEEAAAAGTPAAEGAADVAAASAESTAE